jgi:hypothetical protein
MLNLKNINSFFKSSPISFRIPQPNTLTKRGIRDILLWIRICGSVHLSNGSDSFFHKLQGCQKKFFSYFFLLTYPQTVSKIKFLKKFCIKILFCTPYFSLLDIYMRKGEGSGSGSGPPNTDRKVNLWKK